MNLNGQTTEGDPARSREFAILREMGREVVLPAGARVGDDLVYMLLEGSCSLCLVGPFCEETTLIFFEPGMLLNFVPVLMKHHRLHALTRRRLVGRANLVVRTLADCRLLAVEAEDFFAGLKTSLPLNSLLVAAMTENLLNFIARASYSPLLPAAQRICLFISQMARSTPSLTLPGSLTYDEMARHLSVHSMTIAKVVKRLKEDGVLERRGRTLAVRDMAALEAVGKGRRTLDYRESEES